MMELPEEWLERPDEFAEKFKEGLKEASKRTNDILDAARGRAVFKAKIAEGHRITIPEAERESLDLEIGDLVQVSLEKLEGGEKE